MTGSTENTLAARPGTGRLVIVATPIGNRGDITLRALDELRGADAVLAEDTRVTGKLLASLGIAGKRLERLDENLMASRATAVIERVRAGEVIAYCSDAGMPGVSDPGLRLVAAAREAGVEVEVLPGPTAAACAYVASGTTSPTFYFGGFFPRKDAARRQLLEQLRSLDAALVFYESPNRLVSSLKAIGEVLPRRKVSVCRELTKLHEEVVRGLAEEVHGEFSKREAVKGEVVVVVDPPSPGELDDAAERACAGAAKRALELAEQGERPKSIAKRLVSEFEISRNEAYELALHAKGRDARG